MLNINKTSFLNSSDPRLTGNVKIIIDSNKDIWLHSINSNSDIKQTIFKKYAINSDFGYDKLLFNYLQQDLTFLRTSFWNTDKIEAFKSGPRYNYDENISILEGFKEKYSYFAPLQIVSNNIPDYFIVFKIDNYVFNSQTVPNIKNFLDTQLIKSNIIYTCDLKNTKIGKFLDNIDIGDKLYFPDTIDDYGMYINGINPFQGNITKKFVPVHNFNNLTNKEILDSFPINNLVSSNIYNLEFLFNSDFDNYQNFYGVYLTKENLIELNIDIEYQNEDLKYPIILDNYAELNETSFVLDNNSGVKLYIEDKKNQLPSIFNISVGYANNSYNSPTGPLSPIGVNYGLPYLGATGYNYNSPTGPIGPTGVFLGIEDKKLNLYPIKEYKDNTILINHTKELHLSNTTINLTNFIGIKPNEGKTIFGSVINTPGHTNLKITVNRTNNKKHTLFQNSDYLSIKSNHLNKEWRIIANDDNCCSKKDDNCYYKGKEILFNTNFWKVEKYNNTYVLHLECDGIFNIIEGTKIYLSNYSLTNKEYTVEKIKFDNILNKTIISLIDKDGKDFSNYNSWTIQTIKHIESSFYYTYFDFIGTIDMVTSNITNAFNSFSNIPIIAKQINQDIILYSKWTGDFNNYTLEYNFSNSNTPTNNININDIPLSGIKLFDSANKTIMVRKRGKIDMYGNTNNFNKSRFFVDKIWALQNINGKELITTKSGRIGLDKFYIEDNQIRYSNYLEELNFKNIDKYLVYQIKDKNDDILLNNNGDITASYKFYPKLLKLTLVDNIDILQ